MWLPQTSMSMHHLTRGARYRGAYTNGGMGWERIRQDQYLKDCLHTDGSQRKLGCPGSPRRLVGEIIPREEKPKLPPLSGWG